MESLPFAGGAYSGRSKDVNSQECINFYTERDPASGRAEHYLVGTPGTKSLVQVGKGPIRALHVFGPDLVVVSEREVFVGTPSSGFEKVGELDTIFGPVYLTDNGYDQGGEVLISDTFKLYLYDNDPVGNQEEFEEVELGERPGSVTFMDGYFIASQFETNKFRLSGLYDGRSWNALDIASKEGSPDNIVQIVNDRRELWLFGEKTTEAFYNSGNPDFPFERFQGGFTEMGCVAPKSVAKTTQGLIWLGRDIRGQAQVVVVGEGFIPQTVSPTGINYQIQQYEKVEDAISFVYQIEGHEFYVLTFPKANVTWVYDLTDQFWHKWSVWRFDRHNRHMSNDYVFFNGKHLVGDFQTNDVHEVSSNFYTDNGDPIVRDRIFPHVNDSEQRMTMSNLQMVFEHGVGLNEGQGFLPEVKLKYSKDGGHSWSYFLTRSIGKIGRYSNRALWKKLGQARRWTFWIRMSDPVKPIILDMVASFRGQDHG